MQIVIDIPEDYYKAIKEIPVEQSTADMMIIRNGTPLDKIRAEIEQVAKDYDKFADYRRVYGLWIALDIIDKYKEETEQVGNPDRLEGGESE